MESGPAAAKVVHAFGRRCNCALETRVLPLNPPEIQRKVIIFWWFTSFWDTPMWHCRNTPLKTIQMVDICSSAFVSIELLIILLDDTICEWIYSMLILLLFGHALKRSRWCDLAHFRQDLFIQHFRSVTAMSDPQCGKPMWISIWILAHWDILLHCDKAQKSIGDDSNFVSTPIMSQGQECSRTSVATGHRRVADWSRSPLEPKI